MKQTLKPEKAYIEMSCEQFEQLLVIAKPHTSHSFVDKDGDTYFVTFDTRHSNWRFYVGAFGDLTSTGLVFVTSTPYSTKREAVKAMLDQIQVDVMTMTGFDDDGIPL